MEDRTKIRGQPVNKLHSLCGRVVELERPEQEDNPAQAHGVGGEHFGIFFERAPFNGKGNFLEVNRAWLNTLVYSHEEVIGRWFGQFLSPQSLNHFKGSSSHFKIGVSLPGPEYDAIHKDSSFSKLKDIRAEITGYRIGESQDHPRLRRKRIMSSRFRME